TVLGIEGDLDWASASSSRAFGAPNADSASFKFDAFGSVRGRAGLAFDRTLIYATVGPAWGHFNSGATALNSATDPRVRDAVGDDAWHMGVAAGAGVEFMLAPHWTLRGEY